MTKVQFRQWAWRAVAVIVVLQIYFVRELLAAELLFGLVFAILLGFGFLFYLLGEASERGLDWAEPRARLLASRSFLAARRSLNHLEEISRKTSRHPRSESAQ